MAGTLLPRQFLNSALKLVKNIAALRALPTVTEEYIYVEAHTTSGDGGHGAFRAVTGAAPGTYTDDNGITIVPTGGDGSTAWIRDFTGAVNAHWFGAKGDGVADDTAAIQAAINYLQTTGGVVYLPEGTYIISASLSLYSGITLKGDGPRYRYLYKQSAATHVGGTEIKVPANVTAIIMGDPTTDHAKVEGIAFVGANLVSSAYGTAPTPTAGAVAIDCANSVDFWADNVAFYGLQTGITNTTSTTLNADRPQLSNWVASDCGAVVSYNKGTADVIIRNCPLSLHNDKHIVIRDSDGVRIENCRLFQAFTNSIDIGLATPGTGSVGFVNITGCTLFETNGHSIVIDGGKYVNIAGTTISRAGGYVSAGSYAYSMGLVVSNTQTFAFEGVIERCGSSAAKFASCSEVSLNGSILDCFYTHGDVAGVGIVQVITSTAVNINASIHNLATDLYNVVSDVASALEVTGTVSGNRGSKNCPLLKHANAYHFVIYGTG
ncbi:MAG: hypothetical protein D6706_18360, partial [Chloroflexi bacterium]